MLNFTPAEPTPPKKNACAPVHTAVGLRRGDSGAIDVLRHAPVFTV
jgi:hypothetical protein